MTQAASHNDDARRAMLDSLARGQAITDISFDRIYPEQIRKVSSLYWTPVAVARRAARLFFTHGARRVLDIGAGVGKFCIVSALTADLELTGVEHREGLVAVTQEILGACGVPRVTMKHGTLADMDLDAFDGFYLYNPFDEACFEPSHWLDRSLPLSAAEANRDIERVEAHLARARRGTCLVTFHGFGGAIPEGWIHLAEETRGAAFLRLWVKG